MPGKLGEKMAPAVSGQPYVLDAAAPGNDPAPAARALFGLNIQELTELVAEAGGAPYRARQLAEGLYRRRLSSLEQFTALPAPLRAALAARGWEVGRPRLTRAFLSADGTERYLVACADGETVEAVWMPEGDGGQQGEDESAAGAAARPVSGRGQTLPGQAVPGQTVPGSGSEPDSESGCESEPEPGAEPGSEPEPGPQPRAGGAAAEPSPREGRRRATICISSQVGCAVNCSFCLTARLGLRRNLTAGEIAGQVVSVLERQRVEVGRERVNLVFMGMGEPLLNYDAFLAAVRLLAGEVGLAESRMTVSTSGIVPAIERLGREPVRPRLAVSLNGASNEVRGEVMPINRKWPIEQVVAALRTVRLRPRERITLEYVLLGGVTDTDAQAARLVRLVRKAALPLKVNLIAWNPGPGVAFAMPAPERVERFRQLLSRAGVPVFVRRPRGRDIYAACGQLKRTVEG